MRGTFMKALVGKQASGFVWSLLGRTKHRKAAAVLLGALVVYGVCAVGVLFALLSNALCAPLHEAGLGWFYFTLTGFFAFAVGVVGNVFTAGPILYGAKDNELLFSLPIPTGLIFAVRFGELLLLEFVFEAAVFVPALTVRMVTVGFSAQTLTAGILTMLILPLFSTVPASLAGWLATLAGGRMRHKTLAAVLAATVFLAAYFVVSLNLQPLFMKLLTDSASLSRKAQSFLRLFTLFGRGVDGSPASFALFFALTALPTALGLAILVKSFPRMVTAKSSPRKANSVRMNGVNVVRSSPARALLRKEAGRFFGSTVYFLNSGVASILMLLAAAGLLIERNAVDSVLAQLPEALRPLLPLLACGAVGLFSGMSYIAAPSVSLDDKTLWILRSLPITGRQVLRAKLTLHVLFTVPPTVVLTAAVMFVLRPTFLSGALMLCFNLVFVLLTAAFDLTMGLAFPSFGWTNETVPVKQGAAAGIALFGAWGILPVFAGIVWALKGVLSAELCLCVCLIVCLAGAAALCRQLSTWGARRFEEL